MKDDRRYLQLQAVEPPAPPAASASRDSGVGLDETDGRRTRRSNSPGPEGERLNMDEFNLEY